MSRRKLLLYTPNYAGEVPNVVYNNHKACLMDWMTRPGLELHWAAPERVELGLARHWACQRAVEGGFDYLFWLDDDARIEPHFLPRLLAHEVDFVAVPYPMRPCSYLEMDVEDGSIWPDLPVRLGVRMFEPSDQPGEDHRTLRLDELDQGLIECRSAGLHCCLMKVSLLTHTHTLVPSLQDEYEQGIPVVRDGGTPVIVNGQPHISHKSYVYMPNSGGEDILLCDRLRERGFRFHCDTDLFAGHLIGRTLLTRKGIAGAQAQSRNAL